MTEPKSAAPPGKQPTIEDLHRKRIHGAFSVLSLGEIQLLLLGLWVIGEENRVDPRNLAEYDWLLNALLAVSQGTLAHLLKDQPHIAGAKP